MDRKERISSERYDRNSYSTIFVIFANFFSAVFVAALEVGQLFYVRSVEHLRYRNNQFMLFGESLPGVWLGFLFVITAVTGIIARQTVLDPARRHVRFTVFASLSVVNIVASAFMIGWIGYSLDRMRFDYPQLCKGFPYANTFDHICDYENGYYNIMGLLGAMILPYCVEMIGSFIGAIYGFQKVCTRNYNPLISAI
ncbi:hypothetical protein BV898_06362 [Hypsibius exemplaris]|uniref:Uncharacterized protein n=1 Tax=Hypsibius exemplaris TaxID=2072580 RepID=A0A1W0WWL6_HYPEX|nr:hypothetical protein BV898_06362 [Hypsibius exemplaris]